MTTLLSTRLPLPLVLLSALLLATAARPQGADFAAMSSKDAYAYANKLAAAGQADEAIKVCQYLIAKNDDREIVASAHFCAGMILMTRFETAECLKHFNTVYREFPGSNIWARGYVPLQLGSVMYFRTEEKAQARDLLREALAKHGDSMETRQRALVTCRLAEFELGLGLGDPAKSERVLKEQLPLCPALLCELQYFQRLVDLYLKTDRHEAAVEAARLGYALCRFNEGEIKQAGELVHKVYMSKAELAKATQFLAAQDNPEAPNPLKAVRLPQVSAEESAQLLQRSGKSHEVLMCVYLYLGRNREAFTEATLALAEAPPEKAVLAIQDVARVFKAADLSVVRGNAFINYAKTGEGTNPLDDPKL